MAIDKEATLIGGTKRKPSKGPNSQGEKGKFCMVNEKYLASLEESIVNLDFNAVVEVARENYEAT